jgi:trehalose/maltose hydrolase-like predicted phosphorylase
MHSSGSLSWCPAPADAAQGSKPSTWSLATSRAAAAAAAPAYLGNGYVGTRIPADRAEYASSPVATRTHIAGVYASVPDEVGGGVQRQGSINLPGWTQLDVVVAGQRYASADARRYRQVLDLRRGVLSTRAIWSTGGRMTEIRCFR